MLTSVFLGHAYFCCEYGIKRELTKLKYISHNEDKNIDRIRISLNNDSQNTKTVFVWMINAMIVLPDRGKPELPVFLNMFVTVLISELELII